MLVLRISSKQRVPFSEFFGVISFQDFAAPSLQNDAFDLQTDQSGRPVLAN